jgi:hypothetical protein
MPVHVGFIYSAGASKLHLGAEVNYHSIQSPGFDDASAGDYYFFPKTLTIITRMARQKGNKIQNGTP